MRTALDWEMLCNNKQGRGRKTDLKLQFIALEESGFTSNLSLDVKQERKWHRR